MSLRKDWNDASVMKYFSKAEIRIDYHFLFPEFLYSVSALNRHLAIHI